jgi:transcription antitermination factor NusG
MSISPGDCVVIRSGPFADCRGIVVEAGESLWTELVDSRVVVRVEREQVAEINCGPLATRCIAASGGMGLKVV